MGDSAGWPRAADGTKRGKGESRKLSRDTRVTIKKVCVTIDATATVTHSTRRPTQNTKSRIRGMSQGQVVSSFRSEGTSAISVVLVRLIPLTPQKMTVDNSSGEIVDLHIGAGNGGTLTTPSDLTTRGRRISSDLHSGDIVAEETSSQLGRLTNDIL